MQGLYGSQWRKFESDPAVLHRLLEWVLELHREVANRRLPPGLLEFLTAKAPDEGALRLARGAKASSDAALASVSKVASMLRIEIPSLQAEYWPALAERLETWRTSLDRLPQFIGYRDAARTMREEGLESLVRLAESWPLSSSRLADSFLRSYYTGVVREAMESRPELRSFERGSHEGAIEEFASLDDFMLKYNRARVRVAHQSRLPSFARMLAARTTAY
jgi:hypothetical protein